jgi:glycosyltransferase involved in cell wall biosynthesis
VRVLIIAYTNYAHDGRVRRNAEFLAARGDTVEVICLEGGEHPPAGVRVHRLELARYRGASRLRYATSYTGFFVQAARLAARLSREAPFDIAMACSMPDLAILAALPGKWRGAQLVLDVHDTMPELYRDKFGGIRGALGARLLMLEERLSAALADRVLAVHEPHAARLTSAGVRPDKLRVVTNVPDRALFHPVGGEAAASAASAPVTGPFTVVCHGTVARRLGLEVALRAMTHLGDLPGLRLRIIGQGDYLTEARQLAIALALDGRVSFEGMIPLEQLPAVLRTAAVGLVPNLASAATHLMLPVKLLEYGTLGIPVAAARLKTIEHYFNGAVRFFTPGSPEALASAVRELYDQPVVRAELAVAAARICTRLSTVQRDDYYAALDSLGEREESEICKLPANP